MSMEAFTGSAVHTIDPKGRVFIPTNYRDALGDNFTIALNNDLRTIALYPREIWREKCELLARIPDADRKGINYVRYVIGNAYTGCNLDGQGRILIPQSLRLDYGLTESADVRFIGIGQYLEMWSANRYKGLLMPEDNLADEVLDYVYQNYFRPRNTEQA